MIRTPEQIEDLTFRLLFGGLPPEKFLLQFEDEVGVYLDEVVEDAFSHKMPRHGLSAFRVLRGGLVVMIAANGKMSCFETRARVEERAHISAWASYARGSWTKKVPTAAGMYAVRSLDGRLGFHEFRYSHGALRDISGGHVVGKKSTNWEGWFWSSPLPPYPGAA